MTSPLPTGFELRFDPLSGRGRSYSFPCDVRGEVDLDRLGEHARCNYFYARTVIGREFHWPAVQPARLQ